MNKNKWQNSLNDILIPHIFKGLNKIYNDIKKIAASKNTGVIKPFQLTLMEVKYLPEALLDEDYTQLLLSLRHNDKTEKLLTILISKIYTEILKEESYDCINVIFPKNKVFVHKVYINAANLFFKEPLLFYHKYEPAVINQNYKIILERIKTAIQNTINNDIINIIALGEDNNKTDKCDRLNDIKKEFKTPRNLLDDNSDEDDNSDDESNVSDIIENVHNYDIFNNSIKQTYTDRESNISLNKKINNEQESCHEQESQRVLESSHEPEYQRDLESRYGQESLLLKQLKSNSEETDSIISNNLDIKSTYEKASRYSQNTELITNYDIVDDLTQENLNDVIKQNENINLTEISKFIDECPNDLVSTISLKTNLMIRKAKPESIKHTKIPKKLAQINLEEDNISIYTTGKTKSVSPKYVVMPISEDQRSISPNEERSNNEKSNNERLNEERLISPNIENEIKPIEGIPSKQSSIPTTLALDGIKNALKTNVKQKQAVKKTPITIKLNNMKPTERNKTIKSILGGGCSAQISDTDSTLESLISSYSHS